MFAHILKNFREIPSFTYQLRTSSEKPKLDTPHKHITKSYITEKTEIIYKLNITDKKRTNLRDELPDTDEVLRVKERRALADSRAQLLKVLVKLETCNCRIQNLGLFIGGTGNPLAQ